MQALGQVQRGSGEGSEGSGEGLGGFGAAKSGSTGFRKGSTECLALVQSQVRFNGVPEKVPEKVPGSFGAKPSQGQVPEKVATVSPALASQPASERVLKINHRGCWGCNPS